MLRTEKFSSISLIIFFFSFLQILEDYEKQLQHLKKETDAVQKDFDEWESEQTYQSFR